MTVIAGAIAKDGQVFIGADGAVTQDDDAVRLISEPKVFTRGKFVIGSSGTARVCQIIEYLFCPPVHKPAVSVEEYMVRHFAPKLRKVMKAEGGEVKDEENGEVMNGRCLVGYKGRLFEVDSAYGIVFPALPYHAIGCADQIALGAMYALRDSKPELIVKSALEASAEFDANIRPPFTIKSTKRR